MINQLTHFYVSFVGLQSFLHVYSPTYSFAQTLSLSDSISFSTFSSFSSADRTILIWYLKDLSSAKDRKTFRVNVEYDHVYKLIWSPDSKALLGFKAMENAIEAYRVEKKDGMFSSYARSITFPPAHENDDIVSLDISFNGKFIASASNRTEIILWDHRGNILDKLDTFLMSNYAAKISPW